MAGKRRRKGGWSRERGGRPSRLSDAVASALVQAMQLGMTRGDSAAYAGVSRSSFVSWLRCGRMHRDAGIVSQFSELLASIQKSEADRVAEALELIMSGEARTHETPGFDR